MNAVSCGVCGSESAGAEGRLDLMAAPSHFAIIGAASSTSTTSFKTGAGSSVAATRTPSPLERPPNISSSVNCPD